MEVKGIHFARQTGREVQQGQVLISRLVQDQRSGTALMGGYDDLPASLQAAMFSTYGDILQMRK